MTESIQHPPGFHAVKGCTAIVTGSSGFCGARLVEILLERGASNVICFDRMEPDANVASRFSEAEGKFPGRIISLHGPTNGDLTSNTAVENAFKEALAVSSEEGMDVAVFHLAALVGPFHDREKYYSVNYEATVRIIDLCRKYNVRKLVYSSSPSTRFTGKDVEGLREDQLPIPKKFLEKYAETKAMGEIAVRDASSKSPDENDQQQLLTISVAPHQVYGPHDQLFLPNLLSAAGSGKLRIFGKGDKLISICYVDNYAHGLLCGLDALQPGSDALGKLYIVTDGPPQIFWKFLNQAVIAMGFVDLETKTHLPVWLLYGVAYMFNFIGSITGKKFKLSPFNVCMLTIHRYFSIDNARRDLKYEPLYHTEESWPATIQWFKDNWLPKYLAETGKKK